MCTGTKTTDCCAYDERLCGLPIPYSMYVTLERLNEFVTGRRFQLKTPPKYIHAY